jgi:hypothetical protein
MHFRARIGERYRAEFATLPAGADACATEGLIELPHPADGVAGTSVSMLLGPAMAWRLDPDAVPHAAVAVTPAPVGWSRPVLEGREA